MKPRKPILAPTALDLDTLDQVIGGSRLGVQNDRSAAMAPSADAWSSLVAGGSFQDTLATAFMRSQLDDAPRLPDLTAQAAMLFDDGKPELHCGTMQLTPVDAPPEDAAIADAAVADGAVADAPFELHCGAMPPAVDVSVEESRAALDDGALAAPAGARPHCGTMQVAPVQPDAPIDQPPVEQAPLFL